MRIRKQDADRPKSMSERLRELRETQAQDALRGSEWDGWDGSITPENAPRTETHDDAGDYAGLEVSH